MRCLYCGKPLPLLKKLTGGGEFCSDAHRHKYQEEYNKLALSRLLQAQTPGQQAQQASSAGGGITPRALRQLPAPAPRPGQMRALAAPAAEPQPASAPPKESKLSSTGMFPFRKSAPEPAKAPEPEAKLTPPPQRPPVRPEPPPVAAAPPPLPPPQPPPFASFHIDPFAPLRKASKAEAKAVPLVPEIVEVKDVEWPSLQDVQGIPYDWSELSISIAAKEMALELEGVLDPEEEVPAEILAEEPTSEAASAPAEPPQASAEDIEWEATWGDFEPPPADTWDHPIPFRVPEAISVALEAADAVVFTGLVLYPAVDGMQIPTRRPNPVRQKLLDHEPMRFVIHRGSPRISSRRNWDAGAAGLQNLPAWRPTLHFIQVPAAQSDSLVPAENLEKAMQPAAVPVPQTANIPTPVVAAPAVGLAENTHYDVVINLAALGLLEDSE